MIRLRLSGFRILYTAGAAFLGVQMIRNDTQIAHGFAMGTQIAHGFAMGTKCTDDTECV
jgi:hypothetical protein